MILVRVTFGKFFVTYSVFKVLVYQYVYLSKGFGFGAAEYLINLFAFSMFGMLHVKAQCSKIIVIHLLKYFLDIFMALKPFLLFKLLYSNFRWMNLSLTSCFLALSFTFTRSHTYTSAELFCEGKKRSPDLTWQSFFHAAENSGWFYLYFYFQTNVVRNIQHKILHKPHQEMSFSLVTQSLYNVDLK